MADYDRTTCPYCNDAFEPLPRAKKRCPSCGRPVWVRSGPDGRRYLLREVDLEAHQARWDAESDREADEEAARINREAARLSALTLRSDGDTGVLVIEMFGADDPCSACPGVNGRRFSISHAPPIPVPGCQNEICRCDYLPVLD